MEDTEHYYARNGTYFGLKHSTTTGALMVSNSASYTELTLPQSDDISGVRAIYE